jgi:hypothetical protein
MLARIGIMRALNRRVERAFNPDRKNHRWGRRQAGARPMTQAWPHCFYWISIKWISRFERSLTRALRDLDRAISPDEYLLNCILGCGAHAQRKDNLFVGVKHESDFNDGSSSSNRILCGFFHRDPRSGSAGTETADIDHTSRTLLPVI